MPDNLPITEVEEAFPLPEVRMVEESTLPAAAGTPGRAVASREARDMLAGTGGAATPEVAERLAAIPNVADEIGGQAAAAFRARHTEREETATLIETDGPPVLSLPGVDPAIHENLPDVIRRSVLGIDYEDRPPAPVVPRWLAVYDLPGYMVDGIRALGRTTFKTFPCFRVHDDASRAAGEDPLGSMRILANLQGRGPTPQAELDAMASWIRENGVPIEAGHVEFPIAIPGYSPRIILAGNETTSFLMVDEKRADGAPVDAQYIYAWAGGRRHYLANPQDLVRLTAPVRRQVAVPQGRRRGIPAAPEEAALGNIARLARPALQLGPPVSETELRKSRRAAAKALPVAADVNPEAIMAIRRSGFRPDGPQAQMRLKRVEQDGRISILTANPDFAIGAYLLVVAGEDGAELYREAVNDIEAIEQVLSPTPPHP